MTEAAMPPTTITQPPLEKFLSVTKMLYEADIRAKERAKATHERFNVFTTLLSATDEVRLHTRFIHCLLDPNGCHDCGSLFLDLFFATLDEIPGLDHDGEGSPLDLPPPKRPWTIGKEVSCPPYGQIDLLLDRGESGIAIENKIGAYEQVKQLESYGQFLRKKYGNNGRLIYLTLRGTQGSTHGPVPYIRISYAEHILAWLDLCLEKTYQIIPVNQLILQYRSLVQTLTGKDMDVTTLKATAEFIAANPDIIRYQAHLRDAVTEAKAVWLDQLAAAIIDSMKDKFQVNLASAGTRFGTDPNGGLVIRRKEANPILQQPFEVYIEHDAQDMVLSIGVFIGHSNQLGQPSETHTKLVDLINGAMSRDAYPLTGFIAPTPNWPLWPLGWINLLEGLNDQGFADLMEKEIGSVVGEISKKICEYIEAVERAYGEASKSDLLNKG